MRHSYCLFIFLTLFCYVLCKNNEKTNTDTMGQEIIEIGRPKELPPGIEEEPAGDLDDEEDDIKSTTVTGPAVTTKIDGKKTTTVADARKKLKDIEKIDGVTPEDEETRLEKELAEIYKDTDYKDSADETNEPKETTITTSGTSIDVIDVTDEIEKPIARQRNSFKFAPDSTNKKDIERFRTSIDDINCKNRQKLSGAFTKAPDSSGISKMSINIKTVLCFIFISLIYQ